MSVTRLEGSADRRCRKWRIRASVKIDGKYRVVTETFNGMKAEAEAREAEIKRERAGIMQGIGTPPSRPRYLAASRPRSSRRSRSRTVPRPCRRARSRSGWRARTGIRAPENKKIGASRRTPQVYAPDAVATRRPSRRSARCASRSRRGARPRTRAGTAWYARFLVPSDRPCASAPGCCV